MDDHEESIIASYPNEMLVEIAKTMKTRQEVENFCNSNRKFRSSCNNIFYNWYNELIDLTTKYDPNKDYYTIYKKLTNNYIKITDKTLIRKAVDAAIDAFKNKNQQIKLGAQTFINKLDKIKNSIVSYIFILLEQDNYSEGNSIFVPKNTTFTNINIDRINEKVADRFHIKKKSSPNAILKITNYYINSRKIGDIITDNDKITETGINKDVKESQNKQYSGWNDFSGGIYSYLINLPYFHIENENKIIYILNNANITDEELISILQDPIRIDGENIYGLLYVGDIDKTTLLNNINKAVDSNNQEYNFLLLEAMKL